jgi:homoserine dehydrogenase
VDIVVELIGGFDLPSELIRAALDNGKSVVTANKEVVAEHGPEFVALAEERGASFHFEGAVGGAVPMVAAVGSALAADRILGFSAILNGTTNYILSSVTAGASIQDAIQSATEAGYAETDPGDDLSGADAARKTAILASLAFGSAVSPKDVFTRGIDCLCTEDIQVAHRVGFVIKLLARAQEYSGFIHTRVEPCAVPAEHDFAKIVGSSNALSIEAELAGILSLVGAGAGGPETASAVLSDIERIILGSRGPAFGRDGSGSRVVRRSDDPGRFLLRCLAADGSAAGEVQGCLFSHGVGVESVRVLETGATTTISLITGLGERDCIEKALTKLEPHGILCMSALRIWDEA